MKIENKAVDLLNDKVAKKLLTGSEEGKKYIALLVAYLLGLDAEEVLNNLEFMHPSVGINTGVVDSVSDVVVETNDKYINVEVNYTRGSDTYVKNRIYLCQLYLRDIHSYKDYGKEKGIIQINIDNYDYFKKGDFLYHSTMREDRYNIVEDNFIEIYHINLDKLRESDYNEIREDKLKKILYLFVCKDEEFKKKLYEGDDLMKKINENAEQLARALDMLLYYDPEELKKTDRLEAMAEGRDEGLAEGRAEGRKKGLVEGRKEGLVEGRKEGREEGLVEGRKEGREEGREEVKIEIAKNLLHKNVDKKIILDVTGLSESELNNIK